MFSSEKNAFWEFNMENILHVCSLKCPMTNTAIWIAVEMERTSWEGVVRALHNLASLHFVWTNVSYYFLALYRDILYNTGSSVYKYKRATLQNAVCTSHLLYIHWTHLYANFILYVTSSDEVLVWLR